MHTCPQCANPLLPEPLLPDPDGRFDGHFACSACHLVSLMPMQTPEQIAALYVHSGRVHLLTSDEATLGSERRLRRLREVLGPSSTHRLLEVGPARGEFLAHARQHGWKVDGIEPAADDRRVALEQFGLALRQGMFTPATRGNGDFDALCGWDVLEHCLEPRAVLDAMLSWVRPGGIVVVAVPHIDGVPARFFRERWRYRMAPKHVHQFPIAWFSDFASEHGAEVVTIDALAKIHATLQSALPRSLKGVFARNMPASADPAPTDSDANRKPSVKRRIRAGLRRSALRINQMTVPLPLGDLVEVYLRRN